MQNVIIDLFLIKATDIKDSEKILFCSTLTVESLGTLYSPI